MTHSFLSSHSFVSCSFKLCLQYFSTNPSRKNDGIVFTPAPTCLRQVGHSFCESQSRKDITKSQNFVPCEG